MGMWPHVDVDVLERNGILVQEGGLDEVEKMRQQQQQQKAISLASQNARGGKSK